jgi:hypothetical protein
MKINFNWELRHTYLLLGYSIWIFFIYDFYNNDGFTYILTNLIDIIINSGYGVYTVVLLSYGFSLTLAFLPLSLVYLLLPLHTKSEEELEIKKVKKEIRNKYKRIYYEKKLNKLKGGKK